MSQDLEKPIITLENLTKQYKVLNRHEGLRGGFKDLFSRDYKTVTAVDSINLEIARGEIVGFLGPNGAGKSTTIKMMTGVLMPSSGKITVNGNIPYEDRSRNAQNIGVVFGQRSQLWWALPAIESFNILREIYCIDKNVYKKKLILYKEMLGDDSLFHKPIRQMSLGQRSLCDILAAFLHNPAIVFLDEPTIGLDVTIKLKIRELIRKLNEVDHTTVVLTTHDMGDIEALCEKIVIIDHGKIIYNNNVTSLKNIYDKYVNLKVEMTDENDGPDAEKDISSFLNNQFQTQDAIRVSKQGKKLNILLDSQELNPMEVLKVLGEKIQVVDLEIKKSDLEIIIKKIYEGGVQC